MPTSSPSRTRQKLLPILLIGFALLASATGSQSAAARVQQDAAAALIQPNASGVQGFQLLSADQGWLLLNNRLYWTVDDGTSWKDITPSYSVQATIAEVSFFDLTHGWVILTYTSGEDPVYVVARTLDSGASWQTQTVALFSPGDVSAFAENVYLQWTSPQTGWLVIKQATSINFSLGTLFKTTDGGSTWARLSLPIGEPVAFVTDSVGWVAGGAAGNELYRTQDGGRSWQAEDFLSTAGFTGQQQVYLTPSFSDVNTGLLPVMIANGASVRLDFYISGDGGQSWALDSSFSLDGYVDVSVHPALTVFSPDRFVLAVPHTSRIVRKLGANSYSTLTNSDGKAYRAAELRMLSQDVGWALLMSGGCDELIPNASSTTDLTPKSDVDCTLTISLQRTADGGASWTLMKLPSAIAALQPFAMDSGSGGGNAFITYHLRPQNSTEAFVGHGFDVCEISSLSQMQAWWTSGPYAVANLYIGGSARACANSALTATFVGQMKQQGWKFIPTWVGPQAPCTSFRSRMSSVAATAYTQGVSEADKAVNAAANLALTNPDKSNSVLYYDLEAYNTADSACRTTVKAFMDGWAAELASLGDKSAVYGAPCSSALTDFLSNAHVPNAIWIARWNFSTYTPSATVWGGSCISDSNWPNHQRIRQYTGAHTETWGGVAMSVDSNVIDGILAVPYTNTGAGVPPSTPTDPKPADGTTLDRSNDTWIYWSTDATACSVHISGGSLNVSPNSDCSSYHLGIQKGGSYSWQVTASNPYGTTAGPVWHFNIRPYGPSDLAATAVSPNQINLTWTRSSDDLTDIDTYGIYINGQFVASLPKGTTSTSVSGLACSTTYSFFLRSVRQGVQSVNSSSASASTPPCAPLAFSKIGPVDTAPAESTSPTLSWEASTGAVSYVYCIVSVENSPCGSWISTGAGAGTSVTLTGLTAGTTYYWEVRGLNGSESTDADGGAWWSFTASDTPATITVGPTSTGVPTDTPTPTFTPTPSLTPSFTVTPNGFAKLAPADGAYAVPSSLSLQWNSVPGAQAYIYCFDSINNATCDSYWTIVYSTSAAVSGINPSLTYYWEVEAIKSGTSVLADNGSWWSFTASKTPLTPVATYTPTRTLTPTASAASGTPTATATPGPSSIPSSTATASPTPTPTFTSPALTFTPTRTATITSTSVPGAPGAFGKLTPPNGAAGVSSSLNLTWKASSGASLYIYCFDTVNNGNCDTFWTVTSATGATINGLNPSLTYYWQVQAVGASGSAFADGGAWWSFSMSGTPIPTSSPGPTLTPAATYTPTSTPTRAALTPTHSSTPTSTATSSPGATITPTATPTVTATASPTATPTASGTPGGSITPTATGTTGTGAPGAFGKLTPPNGSTSVQSATTLSWQSSSGASLYIYCFDTSNDGNCATYWTTTHATSISINGLNPNLTYYWQVEAVGNVGATFADGGAWWSFSAPR